MSSLFDILQPSLWKCVPYLRPVCNLVYLNNILPPATLKLFISVLEFLTGSIFLWTCLLKYHFMIEPPKVHRFLFTLGKPSKKKAEKSPSNISFLLLSIYYKGRQNILLLEFQGNVGLSIPPPQSFFHYNWILSNSDFDLTQTDRLELKTSWKA